MLMSQTSTIDKERKNKLPNKTQYIPNEIPDFGDFSIQAEEVKLGNTTFVVSREYSKTSTTTLKQRLEQVINDRITELKWTETPLENPPIPAEDAVAT
jgi:hypothetical protein